MLFPAGVALYTWNLGAWLYRKGYRRGAVGVWLLAAAVLGLPAWLLFSR